MEKDKNLTDADVFEALQEATKLYSEYLEITEVTNYSDSNIIQENYNRDMSHPLNLVFRG